MKTFIPLNYSPVDVFRQLVDGKVIDLVVCETNKYTDQEKDVPEEILKAKLRRGEMITKE